MKKLKLHGFNNLTKSLSFCIYDICYAKTAEERDGYIAYIDELYNANRLTEILSETCSIIGANILNIARQDYEPQGASVTILVSEEPVDPKLIDKTEHPGPLPETVVAHLDCGHYERLQMAVEVKYVVIREGEEKMSFTSKKEADAYDKMLDTADLLDTWLTNSPVQMEDEQREALSLWLAEQKDVLSTILKTGKLPSPQVVGAESEEEDASHAA